MARTAGPTIPLSAENRRTLADAREAAGLTMAALGERLGITHAQVSRVEAGKREPSRELLDRWCATLGLQPTVEIRVTISPAAKPKRKPT